HVLVEANIGEGVASVPLSKYDRLNTRVCRPVGLTEGDCAGVCNYALERIGLGYDLASIFDFLRYLLPVPIPRRLRRKLTALRDPTRFICSTLIAQAFEVVRYPILPNVADGAAQREVLEIRRALLYAPRD